MDKITAGSNTTMPVADLGSYTAEAIQLDQLKQTGNHDRITIHEINNSLGKINNALWLMAREESASTPLFRTCQQIVEKEIAAARHILGEGETTIP